MQFRGGGSRARRTTHEIVRGGNGYRKFRGVYMYSHVDHSRIKAVLRPIFSVFLIFTLYFNTFSQAHAAVGGWTMSNPIAQGASTIYNGAKTVVINGANVVKNGTAKITPTAANVSKVLARGGAGYALSIAVEQLLGAVDWVLDPANNQIKYSDPTTGGAVYSYSNGICVGNLDSSFKLCLQNYLDSTSTTWSQHQCTLEDWVSGSFKRYSCSAIIGGNRLDRGKYTVVNTGQITDADKKTLPLSTVAVQVISNAESETDAQKKAAAQAATMAAAADIVKDAESDSIKAPPIVQQLENTAVTPTDETATGTQTKNPTNPDVTDLSIEFPKACAWAPTFCEAAQTVISFPQTLTNWWETSTTAISEAYTEVKEWAKSEESETPDPETPEINNIDIGTLDTSIFKATAGCPAPIQVPVEIGTGGNVEISYEPICQFASKWSFVAPLIGFLSGAMIIVGVGRKGEDGEL